MRSKSPLCYSVYMLQVFKVKELKLKDNGEMEKMLLRSITTHSKHTCILKSVNTHLDHFVPDGTPMPPIGQEGRLRLIP